MKIIVDFSIVFYKFFHVLDTYEELEKEVTSKLTAIQMDLGVFDMTLAIDCGKSWRVDIFPEYKGTRPNDERKQLARKWYSRILIPLEREYDILGLEGLEADDICYLFACKHDCVVVSGDGDLEQLTAIAKTKLWKPFKRVFYVGDPYFSILNKIIFGDSSDNIPRVAPRGVGPVALKKLYFEHDKQLDPMIESMGLDAEKVKRNVALIYFSRTVLDEHFENLDNLC